MAKGKRAHVRAISSKAPYSTEDKIRAITALRSISTEHMLSNRAIQAAQDVLGHPVSVTTLARWIRELGDQIKDLAISPVVIDVAGIVAETQAHILNDFAEARSKALHHLKLDKTIDAMSGRDSAVVVGIMNDHIIKMVGLAPDEQASAQAFKRACQRRGFDFITMLDDYTAVLNEGTDTPRSSTIDAN